MYDSVTAGRTPSTPQWGAPVPARSPRSERPVLGQGFEERTAARTDSIGPDIGLYRAGDRPSGRLSDVGKQLPAALLQRLNCSHLELLDARHSPWASATFTGCRHEISFLPTGGGQGDTLQATLDRLTDDEIPLRGHIVAEIASRLEHGPNGALVILIEALTVEAG
jgi:hypothetical protein